MSDRTEPDYRMQGRNDAVEGLFRTELGRTVDPPAMLRAVRQELGIKRRPKTLTMAFRSAVAAILLVSALLGFELGRRTGRPSTSEDSFQTLDPMRLTGDYPGALIENRTWQDNGEYWR